MKQVQYHTLKNNQVTVLIGKGAQKRSVTRHTVRDGHGNLIGRNTDERAIPLNARYAEELGLARADVISAELELGKIKRTLPSETVNEAEIAADVAIAESRLRYATTAVTEAAARLVHVEREFPLMVEFVR